MRQNTTASSDDAVSNFVHAVAEVDSRYSTVVMGDGTKVAGREETASSRRSGRMPMSVRCTMLSPLPLPAAARHVAVPYR